MTLQPSTANKIRERKKKKRKKKRKLTKKIKRIGANLTDEV